MLKCYNCVSVRIAKIENLAMFLDASAVVSVADRHNNQWCRLNQNLRYKIFAETNGKGAINCRCNDQKHKIDWLHKCEFKNNHIWYMRNSNYRHDRIKRNNNHGWKSRKHISLLANLERERIRNHQGNSLYLKKLVA
jgi:hypothetical protein